MKNKIFLLLALFLTSNLVMAQARRNATEAGQNQKAMAANQAQLERDLGELQVFESKLTQFETAFANRDGSKIAAIKTDLLSDMQREIEQSEKKIAQDKQEVAQSKSEAASSNREVKRSRRDQATPDGDIGDGRDKRDDKRDRRDDVRDAQDDKNDLEQQIARTTRQKEIYKTLMAFTFSFEPSLQEKVVANKALFGEFVSTMKMDIEATKAEIAEDKREAREDGRERREDGRERRERARNF